MVEKKMGPPLICYTTFNKMGSTVKSLISILNTKENFEMYIVDNDSRDMTWDYIQSLNDPRIVVKKRFERNYGAVNSINWVLTHRKRKQDFINIENDVFNLTSNFVEMFRRVSNQFGPGLIQSAFFREKKVRHYSVEWKNGLFFCPIRLPKKPPMSFCYVPSFVLDRLGYLCEASCLMDAEFTRRISEGLNKKIGITFSVQCTHIKDKQDIAIDREESELFDGDGYTCRMCHECQNICKRTDLYCTTFYPGMNKDSPALKGYPMWSRYKRHDREKDVQKRLNGELPLKCSTYHLGKLEEWEDKVRKDNMEFLANYYEQYLKRLQEGNSNV